MIHTNAPSYTDDVKEHVEKLKSLLKDNPSLLQQLCGLEREIALFVTEERVQASGGGQK